MAIGSKVVAYTVSFQCAHPGSAAASGDLYTAAAPSAASFICRSIDELHTASAEAALAAFSLMKRLYTSVEFKSVYSTFTPGNAASKSLISGVTSFASVVEYTTTLPSFL